MSWRWTVWPIVGDCAWRELPRVYDWLTSTQWDSQRELSAYQDEKLDRLLRYTLENVPYYRDLGLRPDLNLFPSLQRQTLNSQASRLRSDPPPSGEIFEWSSSGSSGEPLRVATDVHCTAIRRAAMLRGDIWGSSVKATDRQVMIWGSRNDTYHSPDWRIRARSLIFNRYTFSCLELDRQRAARVIQAINQLKPELIYGYTSGICSLAYLAEEAGVKARPLQKVVCAGEHLSPDNRERLTRYFGCLVQDRYGAAETGAIAHRCEYGTWHLHDENVLLEVRLPDGSISRSGRGAALCTTLHNLAMPLIRYDIGDIVDLSPVSCACGRGLRTFTDLEGRVNEIIVRPDGTHINMAAFTHALRHLNLRRFRFVQEQLEELQFLMEPTQKLDASALQQTHAYFSELLGPDMRVVIEQHEQIPALPSGKKPYFISALPPDHQWDGSHKQLRTE